MTVDEAVRAIVADDGPALARLLDASPALVHHPSTREEFVDGIHHQLYRGDTLLHVAAAAHRIDMVRALLARDGDVAAANRRGARPLHYAVDGGPGARAWDPDAQREVVIALLRAGADPNAVDKGGTSPLHRAVRNRCAAAVEALLDGGASADRPNRKGSSPLQLAGWTTGRGGTGSTLAKAQAEEIVRLLAAHGARR